MTDFSNNRHSQTQEYWHIDQSQGGVYSLPWKRDNGHTIAAVGSTGCRTCVCVFVELSKSTCFAAHISAIDHAADTAAGKIATTEQRVKHNRARIVPDESQAQELMQIVVHTLCESPSLSDKIAGGIFSGSVGRAVVVCPMKIWGGERATGSFIIQALERFFGVAMKCEAGHGFIAAPGVDQWSLQIVGWKDGFLGPSEHDTDFYDSARYEERPERLGWMRTNARDYPPHGGPWSFAFAKAGFWVHFFDRD